MRAGRELRAEEGDVPGAGLAAFVKLKVVPAGPKPVENTLDLVVNRRGQAKRRTGSPSCGTTSEVSGPGSTAGAAASTPTTSV